MYCKNWQKGDIVKHEVVSPYDSHQVFVFINVLLSENNLATHQWPYFTSFGNCFDIYNNKLICLEN